MSLGNEIQDKADLRRWLIQELQSPEVLPPTNLPFRNVKFGGTLVTFSESTESAIAVVNHELGDVPQRILPVLMAGEPSSSVILARDKNTFSLQAHLAGPYSGEIEVEWVAFC